MPSAVLNESCIASLCCCLCRCRSVYAFGILLYEILTGRRAHAGVPVPLLPHKVQRNMTLVMQACALS